MTIRKTGLIAAFILTAATASAEGEGDRNYGLEEYETCLASLPEDADQLACYAIGVIAIAETQVDADSEWHGRMTYDIFTSQLNTRLHLTSEGPRQCGEPEALNIQCIDGVTHVSLSTNCPTSDFAGNGPWSVALRVALDPVLQGTWHGSMGRIDLSVALGTDADTLIQAMVDRHSMAIRIQSDPFEEPLDITFRISGLREVIAETGDTCAWPDMVAGSDE